MRDDGGGVANEGTSVEAERRKVIGAPLDDTVLARAVVYPGDLSTDPNSDVRRIESEVDDRHGRCARASRLHGHRASHGSAVDAADVVVRCSEAEYGRGVGHTGIERRALEYGRAPEATHLVKEQWHMQ